MYRKSGESSWATREIAALDFLLGIPLEAEREIVLSGLAAEREITTGGNGNGNGKGKGNGNGNGNGKGSVSKKHVDLDRSLSNDGEEKHQITTPYSNAGLEKGGWWDAMIQKDERVIKRREQLELETGILERPSGNSDENGAEMNIINMNMHNMHMNPTSIRPNTAGSSAGGSRKAEATTTASFIPGRRLDGHEATLVHIPREAAQTELKTRYRTVARLVHVLKFG